MGQIFFEIRSILFHVTHSPALTKIIWFWFLFMCPVVVDICPFRSTNSWPPLHWTDFLRCIRYISFFRDQSEFIHFRKISKDKSDGGWSRARQTKKVKEARWSKKTGGWDRGQPGGARRTRPDQTQEEKLNQWMNERRKERQKLKRWPPYSNRQQTNTAQILDRWVTRRNTFLFFPQKKNT